MRSDARSAIIITGALMFPPTRSGITEASMTRRPEDPSHAQLGVHHGGGVYAHLAGPGRVVGSRRRGPYVSVEGDIVLDLGTRSELLQTGRPKGWLVSDLPAHLDAVTNGANIVGLGQEILVDAGRGIGIGGAQAELASAEWAQQHWAYDDTVVGGGGGDQGSRRPPWGKPPGPKAGCQVSRARGGS